MDSRRVRILELAQAVADAERVAATIPALIARAKRILSEPAQPSGSASGLTIRVVR
jgi:hypothetical protein